MEVNYRDCFFRTSRNDAVVEVLDIVNDLLTVQGIDIVGNFFENPRPSSDLGIFLCKNSDRIFNINISDLSCKLYKMPYERQELGQFVLVPLLH